MATLLLKLGYGVMADPVGLVTAVGAAAWGAMRTIARNKVDPY